MSKLNLKSLFYFVTVSHENFITFNCNYAYIKNFNHHFNFCVSKSFYYSTDDALLRNASTTTLQHFLFRLLFRFLGMPPWLIILSIIYRNKKMLKQKIMLYNVRQEFDNTQVTAFPNFGQNCIFLGSCRAELISVIC